MSRSNKQLAWCFAAIIVVGLLTYLGAVHAATQQAQQNYRNLVSACEAGNPVREAVVLATETAAETTTSRKAAPLYARAAQKILDAPFVGPTGARDCRKAIREP